MAATALTIADLPELPADGLADGDLIEIERPQPGSAPNDNHRITAARLRAALDPAAVGDIRLALNPPAPTGSNRAALPCNRSTRPCTPRSASPARPRRRGRCGKRLRRRPPVKSIRHTSGQVFTRSWFRGACC